MTKYQAIALGFWHDENIDDNPLVRPDGLIEVPKWRHALINIAHPLLKQGLVILDTPGLNAIGAEPELTVSLIPQADAVVFILAADTGVTKSDLSIWREHLITGDAHRISRLVVLNKIDTLWDALSSPEQIKTQIERQRISSAEILGLSASQVIPVSAQKGLVAKVTGDEALLAASALPDLELALAKGVMGQRQKLLRLAVSGGIKELRIEAGRSIHIRRRDLAEQVDELRGLRGKNSSVIRHMRSRIELERHEFDKGGAKIHAIRSVHSKLLREVFMLLGSPQLKVLLSQLTAKLKQPGIKFGVKAAYGETFAQLRSNLEKAQSTSAEIHTMLVASFKQLNSEFGFSLQAPKEPDLGRFERDLELIELSHLQYLGVSNILKLSQANFSERLVRALSTRLRVVYESALNELELWNKSAASQLDAQLRERRRNFTRRIDAIERIQNAASGLDERIGEIKQQESSLNALDNKLIELTAHLANTPVPTSAEAASLSEVPPAGAPNAPQSAAA